MYVRVYSHFYKQWVSMCMLHWYKQRGCMHSTHANGAAPTCQHVEPSPTPTPLICKAGNSCIHQIIKQQAIFKEHLRPNPGLLVLWCVRQIAICSLLVNSAKLFHYFVLEEESYK